MSVSVMIALPKKEKQDKDEIISKLPNQTNFQWKFQTPKAFLSYNAMMVNMKSVGTYEETEIHGSVKKSYRQYWWWLW